MTKRKYTKTRRAEQEDETRDKIVEAAVALHEALGPAHTSIKAIAERAGVQRLTVYRHFPDDASLFQACTAHYFGRHPPPAMSDWAAIPDPDERSRAALLAFYKYYRRTEKMMAAGYRDVEKLEALQAPMGQFEAYLDQVRDDLLAGWAVSGESEKPLALTLRHCLRFSTWHAFNKDKLSDKKIVDLVMGWIAPWAAADKQGPD